MTSPPNEDQKNYEVLEVALETYPVISAPADFSKSVMKKVLLSEHMPQFKLSWIDYALTLFATSMIFLLIFLWQLIPAQWIQIMRFQALAMRQRNTDISDLALVFTGTILFFFVVFVSTFLFKRPRSIITRQ